MVSVWTEYATYMKLPITLEGTIKLISSHYVKVVLIHSPQQLLAIYAKIRLLISKCIEQNFLFSAD